MRLRRNPARSRLFGLALLPVLALAATACMGYPADGTVLTPGSPSETASSRLPSLLQQLQGNGGAGLEVFDGSENQVLAAQDAQGKAVPVVSPSPTAVSTVTGTTTAKTATPTPTSAGGSAQTTATTPAGTATLAPTATATPTSTATATATPTASPATPTAVPTSAPTTESGPPTEGSAAVSVTGPSTE